MLKFDTNDGNGRGAGKVTGNGMEWNEIEINFQNAKL